jgi:hypothetical protein
VADRDHGGGRRAVARDLGELLKEGLIIGAVGVAIGIPLGIALARPLLPISQRPPH